MKRKVRFAGVMVIILAFILSGCGLQGTDRELADFLIQAVGGSSTENSTSNKKTENVNTTEKLTQAGTTSIVTEDKAKTTKETTEVTTGAVTTEATTASATEPIPPAWKEAYIAKVRELDASGSPLIQAMLIDLDQDGTPELIASTIVAGGDVYTYADGQVVGLHYPHAESGAKLYYQQGNYLISVSIGGDCMSGREVMIGQKRGNIMGWTGYAFSWDENMNPTANVFQSAGSYTPTYEEACARLSECGVHISYSEGMDIEPFLDYTVAVDSSELPSWDDADAAEAGINAW